MGQQTVDEGSEHEVNYDQWGEPDTIERTWSNVTQSATATYDVMGRMTGWNESGAGTAPAASIAYSYDAVGNIRRSYAQFRTLNTTGAASSYTSVQDNWYRYDAMNRVVIAKGQLSGGTIQRGYWGAELQYDAAGQRVRSIGSVDANANIHNPNSEGPYQRQYLTENQIGNGGGGPARLDIPYRQDQIERYDYTVDGNLDKVYVAKSGFEDWYDGEFHPAAAVEPGELRASYQYDALGRVTRQTDYLGGTAGYDRQTTYNASGQIATEVVTQAQRKTNGAYDTVETTNTTNYGFGAGYALGAAVSVTTTSKRNGTTEPVVTTSNSYDWYGGAVLTQTSVARAGAAPTNSYYNYDAAGQLKSAYINDGRAREVTFTNDLFGQVLRRDETGPATGSPHEVWYRFGGRQMGYVGNNGTLETTYDQSIDARTAAPGTGAFRGGATYVPPHADFDQSVAPITSYAQGGGGGSYTVQAGDTLSGIAQTLWGDGALWYRLAQANGLSGASALATGQVLSVPAGVSKSTHNAGTFEPYDAGRIIGDTSPGVAAAPQAKRNKCGAFGAILMIAVAVAVTIASSGALLALSGSAANIGAGIGAVLGAGGATAGAVATAGVVGGMIGSAASQGVGIALGIQDKFSWKGVALAGLSAAVGGSLGGLGGSGIAGAAIRGVAGSVLTQGIAIATGLQSKFDFVGVAVAGVVGAVGQVVGGDSQKFTRQFGASAASAIAGAATRSILTGTSFGDNVKAVLPDVIGTTIGRLVAKGIAGGSNSVETNGRTEKGGPKDSTKTIGLKGMGFVPQVGPYAELEALADRFPGGARFMNVSFQNDPLPLPAVVPKNQAENLELTRQGLTWVDQSPASPEQKEYWRNEIETKAEGWTKHFSSEKSAAASQGYSDTASIGHVPVPVEAVAAAAYAPGAKQFAKVSDIAKLYVDNFPKTKLNEAATVIGEAAAVLIGEASKANAAERELPTIAFSKTHTPGIAGNIEAAFADGHPSVLNRLEGRDAIRAQRADALAGQARPPLGYSLDEFPFASSQQGGAGARIAQVPVTEQNIQGGMLSSFYQKYGIKHGDPFKVIVKP